MYLYKNEMLLKIFFLSKLKNLNNINDSMNFKKI